MKKALVCCLSGIGNCISTIPLIKALKAIDYQVSVCLSKPRGAAPIFEALEEVDKVYDHGQSVPVHDVACCTHLCMRFHDGCPYGKQVLMIEPGLVKDFSPFSIRRYQKHEIEYCMDHARQLGFRGTVPRVLFPTQGVEDPGVGGRVNPVAVCVGYHKGDDFSHNKHWGNENFAELLCMLVKDGFSPVVLGSDSDRENVDEILNMAAKESKGKVNKESVLDVVGKPLMQALKAFQLCKLCLTNETMWTVASSTGVPCVSMVFEEAHNNPLKTYPYPSGVALTGRHQDLSPSVVYKTLMKVWNKGEPRRWARILNVGDKTVTIAKTHLHALRMGLGLPRPKVSVLILMFDKSNETLFNVGKDSLDQVRKTVPADAEIVIVANEPSDKLRDLIAWVEKIDQRIISISTNQNVGVVAKNFGFNAAQGEYVISIDSDVIVDEGWVEKMVSFMEAHPDAGVCAPCGGRLRVDKWAPDVWPCGDFNDDGPRSFFGYEDAEYFGEQTATAVDGDWLDVVPSMCWCFRREVFDKIGYPDWRFGPFVGSDADFCLRVKKAGYRVLICRVPIRHKSCGGSTHTLFSDLENLRMDHIRELRRRWYPAAWKLCGLFPEVGGYNPKKGKADK
jgi:GT2 family glycosyltransferase/ADP-heptose:LPS heptosyltransferase